MGSPGKKPKNATPPLNKDRERAVIAWLKSREGQARLNAIYDETEKRLQAYRELQTVDPRSITVPVTG